MQDIIDKIKEAEGGADKEIIKLKESLSRERRERVAFLEEKKKEIEKSHKEKLAGLKDSLSSVFEEIDKEEELSLKKEKDRLQKTTEKNNPIFVKDIFNKVL